MSWESAIDRAIAGGVPSREEALAMLAVDDDDTLALVEAAWRVRRHFHGRTVKVNLLVNAKSGVCVEDCHYCSQSASSSAEIERYGLLGEDEMIAHARRAATSGADRVCIVTSSRAASWSEVRTVARATATIRTELGLAVCASLGMIDEERARVLAEAGVSAYNHNLNTSAGRYGEICTTHGYEERLATVQAVRRAGISPCSGVIIGMGESAEDVVEMAFALAEVEAGSIPVNFLIPIPGTEAAARWGGERLPPWHCLRVLCLFRFVNPSAELRASAGREHHLRSLQPLALMVANSLFLGDYLTSDGQAAAADWAMLEDLGLEAETSAVDKLLPVVPAP